MNLDKKRLYIISGILIALFFFVIFIPSEITRIITSILLIPITVGICKLIKKRVSLKITKKEVFLIALFSGLLYVMIFYLTGLFYGFYRTPITLTFEKVILWVVPIIIIIITNEIIRKIFLMQNNKFASISSYIVSILIEILLFYNLWNIGFISLKVQKYLKPSFLSSL